MKAYDQQHVKGNEKERKHVTFLLNRMGYLTSKIAKERLARSGRELNRHGRMRKGAELSKKERKESIAGERKWAGEVRWLSILLSKGIQGYRKFDKGKKSQASQAHLHSASIEMQEGRSRGGVVRTRKVTREREKPEQKQVAPWLSRPSQGQGPPAQQGTRPWAGP